MANVPAIEVEQLRDMLQSSPAPFVIDVREKWENDLCQIPGSILIPLGSLAGRLDNVPKDRPVVLHCHHGNRSARATAYLRQEGYDAYNLAGGIHAWSQRIDPAVKTYQ